MKIKLYIDFDGVILNTIDVSYKKIKEIYGENATTEEAQKYYQNIDWDSFLKECSPINNSVHNLKKLADSELYDVAVLTHVLSTHEEEVKKKFLMEQIPNIEFIPVRKPFPKWASVSCENAVLVDDYGENLDLWQEHGGIPVKFSIKDKKYQYLTIKSLEELMELYPIFINSIQHNYTKVRN